MTKQAMIIGGGSKNGIPILESLIENHYSVINFGSSMFQHPNVTNVQVQWHQMDITFVQKKFSDLNGFFDFVFFNHNASSLEINDFDLDHDDILAIWRRIKDWQHSNWISCQMPFLILHTMRKNLYAGSKIGWMLSSYIYHDKRGNMDFPDYSANKYFNYLSMKAFGQANQVQTFGIMPDFSTTHGKDRLRQLVNDIINHNITDTDLFTC